MLAAIGAAMTPVMFAYGGWQTSSFVADRDAQSRGATWYGRCCWASPESCILYTSVAFVCVYALGPDGLAQSADAGDRHDAARARRYRRDGHCPRHRDFRPWLPQPGDADRAARLFCDGRGRGLLPQDLPRSAPRTRVPVAAIMLQGGGRHRDCPVGHLRTDIELCRFGRFHLVRNDRRGAVRLPATRPASAGVSARPAIRSRPACSSPPASLVVDRNGGQQSGQQPGRLPDPARRIPACRYWQRANKPGRA